MEAPDIPLVKSGECTEMTNDGRTDPGEIVVDEHITNSLSYDKFIPDC